MAGSSSRLNAARNELVRCRECIAGMEGARGLAEFEEFWRQFLVALARVRNKAKSALLANASFGGWDGHFEAKVKADPWLSYLRHARNADEHTIQQIMSRQSMTGKIHGPGIVDELLINNGRIERFTGNVAMTLIHHIRLLPVVNKGETYNPPFVDPVDELGSTLPRECERAVVVYEAYVNEAEQRFGS
jgi:hypothetical protein